MTATDWEEEGEVVVEEEIVSDVEEVSYNDADLVRIATAVSEVSGIGSCHCREYV